ncbi:ATP-grasp domain-containing protein [Clostridium felsineum]|uniref:ATP-grasp domain-containing protein n=1 Tax=Clostridium felsineum TaxID=36839 RepID=UPI00098CC61B|nr:ATP-grasp domain-containing protein [Clostridium felsineum]URZ00961.1 Carbamoyl-phosphate synthase large chain [Clostridium felsineum]
MNILLTAVGKRVQLIKCLQRNAKVFGCDISGLAPAAKFVDGFFKVKKYNEEGYIEDIFNICKKEKIDFLIPLFEREFLSLCTYRKELRELGTELILSGKSIIEICNDKWKTYEFFKENNIDSPITYLKGKINKDIIYPLIIKPLDGMGSSSVFKINNEKELNFFSEYVENPILQQFIEGREYTIDTLCDLKGRVIFAIPRERIEVRSGEVTKSRTVKDENIIKAVKNLCEKLQKEALKNGENVIGPLTIQCIVDNRGKVYFIEINPRFGGGVPLSFEAGGDYGKCFKDIKNNINIETIDDFKELTMLRYDEAIYI